MFDKGNPSNRARIYILVVSYMSHEHILAVPGIRCRCVPPNRDDNDILRDSRNNRAFGGNLCDKLLKWESLIKYCVKYLKSCPYVQNRIIHPIPYGRSTRKAHYNSHADIQAMLCIYCNSRRRILFCNCILLVAYNIPVGDHNPSCIWEHHINPQPSRAGILHRRYHRIHNANIHYVQMAVHRPANEIKMS